MQNSQFAANRVLLALMLAAGIAAGCGGGSGDGADNGAPPEPPPPSSFGPNFSEIQDQVFTPTCAVSGCHTGAGAPEGLRLDEANSFGMLVDVASSQVPSILRVAPGDPDNSYLIQKLEGTASVGVRMPESGPPLPQASIDVIRQWIIDGAIDDRAPSSEAIRVTSLSPMPDSDLETAPDEIIAMFDRELDVSTVNAETFILEASGGDGTFSDGNEEQVEAAAITTPDTNPMSATFDLSGAFLAEDTYRVRLLGSGASVILDLDANALDGEFSGTFPSGDGAEGGDFEAVFTVAAPAETGPTLDEIQTNVFTPTCSVCHTGPMGGTLPNGMDLTSADASFANLVGVPSTQVPELSRVEAGDPDNSYIIQKLEGTAEEGEQMPFGGPPLDQAVIDDIRQWIADGAER
ncbi:MAG: Ig-like domain-containing protein [Woeseia sp.]